MDLWAIGRASKIKLSSFTPWASMRLPTSSRCWMFLIAWCNGSDKLPVLNFSMNVRFIRWMPILASWMTSEPSGFRLVARLFGQLAVLDDCYFAFYEAEIADLFVGVCFYYSLGGHLGLVEAVQSYKKRVKNINKRVINLPIAKRARHRVFSYRQLRRFAAGL